MRYYKEVITLATAPGTTLYDITDRLTGVVSRSEMTEAHMMVMGMHTTVGLYINESEKFLLSDIARHLALSVPNIPGHYAHDNIEERNDCPSDEPENAHAHLKASLYANPSVSLIVSEGALQLGCYQRVFFAEFDGPCPRKHKSMRTCLVHLLGEST